MALSQLLQCGTVTYSGSSHWCWLWGDISDSSVPGDMVAAALNLSRNNDHFHGSYNSEIT